LSATYRIDRGEGGEDFKKTDTYHPAVAPELMLQVGGRRQTPQSGGKAQCKKETGGPTK